MSVDARNRLQPSLLDRLTDDQRGERHRAGPARATLAMRTADAAARGVDCIGDLADRSRNHGLRVGVSAAFAALPGGWPALRRFYALPWATPVVIERAATVDALLEQQVDVVDLAAGAGVDGTVVRRLVDDRDYFLLHEIETDTARVLSKVQFRQGVLRDLNALFNAVQSLSTADAVVYPSLRETVLNYGMPPLTGQLASKLDITVVVGVIRETILRFEPRVMADSLEVRAIESESVLDTHNVIEFEIRGHLWSQPLPIEILLRTQLDLEAGQVNVRELNSR